MTASLTITCDLHFTRRRCGRREVQPGHASEVPCEEQGRVPRVARLMALAIRLEQYLRDGVIGSQSELAELGQVTRARITQIMNLLYLAPDIQEEILYLPRVLRGRAPFLLRDLQPIASVFAWQKQRRLWRELLQAKGCA